ncbi:MAG: ABC transporter substrate-binding protein [Ruminococcus sp.]|nr:ABC transporter substrate-binding protein [Ruminococcus sp.]
MIKKVLSVMLACVMLLSTAAALTSCGEEQEFPVKIGSITINKEPKNIVILDKNLSDIISAIGYDIKMVGRSDEVNQKALRVVPSMGTAQDPSVEKIKKEKAEIVFANDSLNKSDVEELKKAGIVVAQFNNATTIKQLKSLYIKIGRMLGGNNEGKEAALKAYKEIKSTLEAVKTAAKRDKTVSTIAYFYTDNGVLKTIIDGSWESTLLDYTGSVNVFKTADSDVVDIDKLLLANPDHIFVASKKVKKYMTTSDVLGKLKALDENTFVIPRDELTLQGFTCLDVLEEMIGKITPQEEESSEASAE